MYYIIFTILLGLLAFSAEAIPMRAASCVVLPNIHHAQIPRSFNMSSSMDHLNGSWQYALGERLHITGKILDDNCDPLVGATIQIWQKSPTGKEVNFNYEPLINDDLYDDTGFANTGSAVTNSNGEYHFFTVAPKDGTINFVITYDEYPTFSGMMYLTNAALLNAQKHGPIRKLHKELQNLFIAQKYPKGDGQYTTHYFDISVGIRQ